MKDEDFDKTMNKWAAYEVESSPQMRPTERMYRMIETGKRKTLVSSIHAHRILAVVAILCLFLSLVVLPVVFYLSDRDGKTSIGLRKGPEAEKDVIVRNPPRRDGKGPKRGSAIPFYQLMFQYQKADSPSVYGFDMRFPMEEEVTLTAADNYRFAIQPSGDRYVYVYQRDYLRRMLKLFPNDVYSSTQNPLKQEQTYHLPSEPNWFCPGKGEGEESIYIIASAPPIPELENLYNQYGMAKSELERQENLSLLLKRIEAVGQDNSEEAIKWVFKFQRQSR